MSDADALKRAKELVDKVYRLKLEAAAKDKDYKDAKNELAELMETSGIDKIQADDCTASLSLKTSVSVPKDITQKKALFTYIKSNHGEEVLRDMLTINARTFSSWHDKEIEAKAKEGDIDFKLDMVEPYEYFSVGLRKRSKK